MRRRIALAVVPALLVAVAACGGKDDTTGEVDTEAPAGDLATALIAAQAAMPVEVPDSRVRILIEDLCAAGPADTPGIVGQLTALPVAGPAEAQAVLDALEAGTSTRCPGGVEPAVENAVAEAALAAAPTTTTTPPAVAAAPASGTSGGASSGQGSTSPSSSSSGDSSTSNSSSSGSSNSSSGSGVVGGGSATGTGNQSTTDYGQSFGSTG